MEGLFGGGGSSSQATELQKQQVEMQQRRSLADLSRQQGEVDQSGAGKVGRKTGSKMLTFLSGDGASKFGSAG